MNTLSGRFLVLTVIFVMLAEVLIFVPSVARFRQDYFALRLERAQIASLALLTTEGPIDPALEVELLENAGVYNVVLRRDEMRQLVLSSPLPEPVHATYDMRDPSAWELIGDAGLRLIEREDRVIRVIGQPVRDGGLLIEVTMQSGPLRDEMLDYGLRILLLSAVISIVTAGLLFLAVRRVLVRPIKSVVAHMQTYAEAPEDAGRIIAPTASVRELREAEEALASMQNQLTGALRQKERLAQLGGAVSKISHDLRNILTSAQLFTDRIEGSDDPLVRRLAPKLVNSITRAVTLCETTLAFGRVDEPPPALRWIDLAEVVDDVTASEELASAPQGVETVSRVAPRTMLRADPEQLYRVISNLVRNAAQAVAVTGGGRVEIAAREDERDWIITVCDDGPGLPPKAREHLFTAFQGSVRKGGSGLGLVIAQELARGHGGEIALERTGPDGTVFAIRLPRAEAA
ncbi:MAG: sensor histidine kinase [Paracoccaceae bacterium]